MDGQDQNAHAKIASIDREAVERDQQANYLGNQWLST